MAPGKYEAVANAGVANSNCVKFAASFVLIALLAGCSAARTGTLPSEPAFSAGGNAGPERRGKITLYEDTFGDATPQGIATGPDGALWFVDTGNDVIGRITAGGSFTNEYVAGAELSGGITAGPDGALWFTIEQSNGGIGRITTAGAITLFNDSGGSYPQGITTGPDGALWFAESNGAVGRITTSGVVTHIKIAPADAGLDGIVTGPDGRLWVTQFVVGGSRLSDKVIRLATNGQKRTYTVGSGPGSICVGPDGALWFAEEGAGALGRLTTAGSYSEIKTKYGPVAVATGPDGALWFTAANAKIGRLTKTGKATFYSVPASNPGLGQITPGPDGAMWFTSAVTPSAIGRVTTH